MMGSDGSGWQRLAALAVMLAVAFGSACGTASTQGSRGVTTVAAPPTTTADRRPIPTDGGFDYQLGGAYDPPADAQIVVRDRLEPPAPGRFSVCYINGFQAQESERAWWEEAHPDLLLRDDDGKVVTDPNWNEALLDISTAAKRAELAEVVGGWIDKCADDGFAAVDPDNLDTFERSDGRISADDAVAFSQMLITRSHARGLPIGQKNAPGLLGQAPFDFLVTESCEKYDECDDYAATFSTAILEIEYIEEHFAAACAKHRPWPVILRDVALRPLGTPGYVYETCPPS